MATAAGTQYLIALLGGVKEDLLEELFLRLRGAGYDAVRPSHMCVFRSLDPDGSRLSDLAEQADMTKQAFGEHVAKLEAAGYIERRPDPRDGRAKLVVPTERGRGVLLFAGQIAADIEREWSAAIGAERIAQLRETLEELRALTARVNLRRSG
ncbi:MAG TPA: MarR family transcriptional regulator [Solirubrobacteraceae bacterium]|jgi:DNA-binding MarR family transcriptional regulator|nr:MarR family transcriptional regulator [Solirubrobacteraceae bacterium]